MNRYTLSTQKKSVDLSKITGQVLEINTKVETHVRGGGAIRNGSGNIDISSYNTYETTIWMRTLNGHERTFLFNYQNLNVRKGQIISVVTSLETGIHRLLVNHNLREWWYVNQNKGLEYEGLLNKSKLDFESILHIAGIVILIFFIWSGSIYLGMSRISYIPPTIISVGLSIFLGPWYLKKRLNLAIDHCFQHDLKAQLNRIGNSILSNQAFISS